MKIKNLRKKIIINSLASLILLIILAATFFYTSQKQEKSEEEIIKIRQASETIKTQSRELEAQTKDAKKYKEIWKNLSKDKKSLQGIKMDEINASLDAIAQKYDISSKNLQVLLPESLNSGVFLRKTIDVSYSNATLEFNAASDVKAINFINEFFESIPGYVVVSSFEISKTRKYENDDLVALSQGKNSGNVKAKISFGWFVYHEKEKKSN